MTKQEAAIVSAYTGILIGEFDDMHEYIEKIMERPIFTHELGSPKIWIEVKQKSKQDFINIKMKEK
jgi:hypothetical protein